MKDLEYLKLRNSSLTCPSIVSSLDILCASTYVQDYYSWKPYSINFTGKRLNL